MNKLWRHRSIIPSWRFIHGNSIRDTIGSVTTFDEQKKTTKSLRNQSVKAETFRSSKTAVLWTWMLKWKFLNSIWTWSFDIVWRVWLKKTAAETLLCWWVFFSKFFFQDGRHRLWTVLAFQTVVFDVFGQQSSAGRLSIGLGRAEDKDAARRANKLCNDDIRYRALFFFLSSVFLFSLSKEKSRRNQRKVPVQGYPPTASSVWPKKNHRRGRYLKRKKGPRANGRVSINVLNTHTHTQVRVQRHTEEGGGGANGGGGNGWGNGWGNGGGHTASRPSEQAINTERTRAAAESWCSFVLCRFPSSLIDWLVGR